MLVRASTAPMAALGAAARGILPLALALSLAHQAEVSPCASSLLLWGYGTRTGSGLGN